MNNSVAVASLKYNPHARAPEENKFGYVIWNGDAHTYHEWKFRTELKLTLSSETETNKIMREVIET